MCYYLNVSRNAYYVWRLKPKNQNNISNRDVLVEEIKSSFTESRETYGSPRIAEVLSKRGFKASHTYVTFLMKEENICCIVNENIRIKPSLIITMKSQIIS